jgi:hypothetical protein
MPGPAGYRTQSGENVFVAKKSDWVVAPGGQRGIGHIDADPQNNIEDGDVYVNAGMIQHAEQGHGEQIREAGYSDALDMVTDVLSNYTEIRKGNNGVIYLVKRSNDRNDSPLVVVGVVKEADGAYHARSERIERHKSLDRKNLLSTRNPHPSTPTPASGLASLSDPSVAAGEESVLVGRQESKSIDGNLPQRPESRNPDFDGDAQALTSGLRRTEPAQPAKGRYSLASGKSIEQASPDEFVLKDGSPTWGHVTEELTQGSPDVPVGELRVQVGDEKSGIVHSRKHLKQINDYGVDSVEEFIDSVYQSADAIIPVDDGKHFMFLKRDGEKIHPSAVVAWKPGGNYYTLVSSFPVENRYIESQKKQSPPLGSGPQAPVPIQAPNMSDAPAGQSDEDAAVRYGNDDLIEGRIEQSPESVNPDFGGDTQALTSDTRRMFEPEMPEQRPLDAPVTIASIREKIRKLVPLRHGKTGRKSEGVFRITPEVIRSKYRNDIPVIMHELGHFLDKKLGLSAAANGAAAKELAENGQVASGKKYTPEQTRKEGIAQFVLHYAVNDKQAREKFPEFYKAFESALSGQPELKTQIAEIKALVTDYFTQTPEQRLSASIVHGDDKGAEGMADRARRYGRKAYGLFVDSLSPLKKITDEVREKLGVKYLEDDINLYARARTAAGWKGKADQDAEPFLDVIRGLRPEDHDALSRYLAASRALNYRAKGMEPGLGTSLQEEREIFNDAPDRIKDAALKLRDIYNETVLKTLVKAGIMSQEQYDYLQMEWPDYVPFLRVDTANMFEHDLNVFLRGRGKSLVNLANPVKKATGVASESEVYPIRDPLESMLRNMQTFHALAARNEVGKTMLGIAEIEGMGRFAERVGGAGEKGDSVFYVWRDGKKEFYATDPDIYAALAAVNEASPTAAGLKKLAEVVTLPAEVFKMGTTRYNPGFIVRNFMRDAANVAINSESWTPPAWNTLKGLTILYSKNPKMQALLDEAVNEGVLYSGITEIRGNTPKALAKEIKAAFREGGITGAVKQKLGALAEWVGSKNAAVEVAPKLYEYYYLRGKGVPKQEAAMRAREVNVDFARAGSAGRNINKATAFFNANVQGVDKAIRTAIERPTQTAAKTLMYVALPSLVSWALGQLGDDEDREEYEEITRQQKDLFWHFKMGDEWARIPKPDIYGMAGSVLERGLDAAFKKDPAAFRGLAHSLWEAGVPPLVPTLIMPWAEIWANKDAFTGRPIVSQKYDSLPPEMQYGPWTSGASKQIGQYIGVSPMKIDHAIRGMTGTVGGEIAKFPDRFIGGQGREETKLTEEPFIRSFFTDPYRNSESIDRFYEIAELTGHAKTRYESGREGAGKDARFAEFFSKASRHLSEVRKTRAETQQSPYLSPGEKRKRLDNIDKYMVGVARNALKQYDGYRSP